MNQRIDETAERILREATRLFATRGYAGTSISAIAAASGVTGPTLLYHFRSKAGLLDAVLTSILDHWQAELPRLMSAATGGGPRLDNLLSALLAFFTRRPELARLVLRELLDRPEAFRERLRRRLQPWTGLLTEAVRMGQAGGQLQPDTDPEAFTVLMISTAIGIIAIGEHAAGLTTPEPSTARQQAELIRIARAGLLVRSSPPTQPNSPPTQHSSPTIQHREEP